MLRVALTGGMGSGKSTVAAMLARHGAVVVHSDELAREVVAPGTPGLARVVAEFGPSVLAEDGSLDRAAMAAVVFADPDARRRLERIVHPLVREAAEAAAAAAPPSAVFVQEIPLLAETGSAGRYDLVIVVDVPEHTQVERLAGPRGVTEAEARARLSAQASRQERLALADVVIDNSGDPEHLAEQVARVWERLRAAAAG